MRRGTAQGEELSLEEKKERAKHVTLNRILTDEDFKKIGRRNGAQFFLFPVQRWNVGTY